MRQFFAVVAFSLLTIGFFTAYSKYGIPHIEPAPPPKQEKVDVGAMDMDGFIALGEKLVSGKGTCTLCHNDLGRAPLLEKIVPNTEIRLADANYKGEAKDLAGYIYESMVKPSAYVVDGFGKAGKPDESPMPDVSGGSTRLSEPELLAIVAYLQTAGGAEVTVEIPKDAPPAKKASDDEDDDDAEPREAIEDPAEILAMFSCGACHKIGEDEGDIGPDLTKIGATHNKDYLRRAIIDPNADIPEGYEADTMPDDIGSQIYVSELEILVTYLAGLK